MDKLLSETLQYGHVLYCMDNETAVTPAWGEYWATYIQKQAATAGQTVETTEMWDPWDLSDEKHKATFDHPETYSFCDISQNNHQKRQRHWDNAQRIRRHSHRSVPSIILRFTVLMVGDSVVRKMGWSGFGEISSADSHQLGFTVPTVASV